MQRLVSVQSCTYICSSLEDAARFGLLRCLGQLLRNGEQGKEIVRL